MNEEKIIQIISPSIPSYAVYKDETAPNGLFFSPICCYALVEDEEGDRYVRAMEMSTEGIILFVDVPANFAGVCHDPSTFTPI